MTQREQSFFEDLYKRHYQALHQFIGRLIQDPEAAHDLVQDTFTLVYTNLNSLMQHPNAAGWLYRTARNQVMNYLRLSFHHNVTEEALQHLPSEHETEATVLQHFFPMASLSEILTEQELALLLDRFEYGYSMEETASRHGLTKAACKMRLSRIYKKLRQHPEILLFLLLTAPIR